MITVKVKLFAGLDKLFPDYNNSEFMPVQINPGAAVRDLIEADDRFQLGPIIKDLARLPRVVQAMRK